VELVSEICWFLENFERHEVCLLVCCVRIWAWFEGSFCRGGFSKRREGVDQEDWFGSWVRLGSGWQGFGCLRKKGFFFPESQNFESFLVNELNAWFVLLLDIFKNLLVFDDLADLLSRDFLFFLFRFIWSFMSEDFMRFALVKLFEFVYSPILDFAVRLYQIDFKRNSANPWQLDKLLLPLRFLRFLSRVLSRQHPFLNRLSLLILQLLLLHHFRMDDLLDSRFIQIHDLRLSRYRSSINSIHDSFHSHARFLRLWVSEIFSLFVFQLLDLIVFGLQLFSKLVDFLLHFVHVGFFDRFFVCLMAV